LYPVLQSESFNRRLRVPTSKAGNIGTSTGHKEVRRWSRASCLSNEGTTLPWTQSPSELANPSIGHFNPGGFPTLFLIIEVT
jgi:hypothetical protein